MLEAADSGPAVDVTGYGVDCVARESTAVVVTPSVTASGFVVGSRSWLTLGQSSRLPCQ